MPTIQAGWSVQGPTGTSITASPDVGSGANRAAYVVVVGYDSIDPTGVTVGSDSLTLQSSVESQNTNRFALYAGELSVSGTQTVTATFASSSASHVMIGVVLSDADVATLLRTPVKMVANIFSSAISETCNSGTGDLALMLYTTLPARGVTPGSGVTTIAACTSGVRQGQQKDGASPTVTMEVTLSGNAERRGFIFSVPHVSAGDTTAPTITSVTGTGGAASSSGSFTSDEAGTAYWKLTATSTPESVPAYPDAMTGWTSMAMVSGANSIASLTATPGTYWLQVVGEDASGNRGAAPTVSAASFTVTAGDSTNPSAPGTPTFASVTKTTAAVNYTAATDNVGVAGYEYRLDGGSVVDVGDVLTFGLTGQTPGDTVTLEVRAYDAAGNRGAWASADVTFLIYGIDFDDPALDLEVGNVSGSLVDLGMLASTSVRVTIQDPDTSAVVHEATVSTSAAGVLPRVQAAALDGQPYVVLLQTTEVDPMDRSVASIIIEATTP